MKMHVPHVMSLNPGLGTLPGKVPSALRHAASCHSLVAASLLPEFWRGHCLLHSSPCNHMGCALPFIAGHPQPV